MFHRDFGWFECSQVILEGIPLKHVLNAILLTILLIFDEAFIWKGSPYLNLFGRDLLTDEAC